MKYSLKEYIDMTVFDTPAKNKQEKHIVGIIIGLLNNKKYDNLERFIEANGSFQNFKKKYNVRLSHFGDTLKEQDYIDILNRLREYDKKKKSFEADKIKTTKIGDQEINSYEGSEKTYFADNSLKDRSIVHQMEDLQQDRQEFQTTDEKKNTENMFKKLEDINGRLNLVNLNEAKYMDMLNSEEKKLVEAASKYGQVTDDSLKIDLDKKIIIGEDNSISKIDLTSDNDAKIVSTVNNYEYESEIAAEPIVEEKAKTYQKTLTPTANSIYAN